MRGANLWGALEADEKKPGKSLWELPEKVLSKTSTQPRSSGSLSSGASGGCLQGGASLKVEKAHLK